MDTMSHGCLDKLVVKIVIHDVDNLLKTDFRRRYAVGYLGKDVMQSVED